MSFLAKLMTNAANTPVAAEQATVVGIRVNAGEIIYLSPEQYANKSIAQLFADNASELGISSNQVTKFQTNGTVVAGTATPVPGAIYQGSIETMQKG